VDLEALGHAIVSLLVITAPFDPVKILFFNQAIAEPARPRTGAALCVAVYIVLLLGGAALVGREFLNLLGIDLQAFSAVGGLIITLMGFEMLYSGGASKAQGESQRKSGPDEGDSLLIPLTLPLIAGPGAIATTIAMAARTESFDSVLTALIAVGVVAVVAFASFAWLGGVLGKAKPATTAVLVRIGGLLLATIGAQMMLSGLKGFFA